MPHDPEEEARVNMGQVKRFGRAARRAERFDMGQFNNPPRPQDRGPFPIAQSVFVVEVTGELIDSPPGGPIGLYPGVVREMTYIYSLSPINHGPHWNDVVEAMDGNGSVDPCYVVGVDNMPLNVGEVGIGVVVDEFRDASDETAVPVPIFAITAVIQGAGSGSGSGTGFSNQCTGVVRSSTESRVICGVDGCLYRGDKLVTWEYDANGCLVVTEGEESFTRLDCVTTENGCGSGSIPTCVTPEMLTAAPVTLTFVADDPECCLDGIGGEVELTGDGDPFVTGTNIFGPTGCDFDVPGSDHYVTVAVNATFVDGCLVDISLQISGCVGPSLEELACCTPDPPAVSGAVISVDPLVIEFVTGECAYLPCGATVTLTNV